MVKTYDLDLSASQWYGVDRLRPKLAKLDAPKWTKAQQLAEPNEPRTRLVKDVLRVGRWRVGRNDDGSPRWWDVTPETLQQIEDSFRASTAAGNEFNLCYGHGDPDTKIVDARDTIEPLDQVFSDGRNLWASVYVDLATANELRKPSRKVSVRVVDSWVDGAGKAYSMALLHVAVVDLPVMTGQGKFLDLSHSFDGGTMDYETMLGLWKRAMALLGLGLPENVSEETLPIVVDTLLGSQEGMAAPEDDTETQDPATPPLNPAAGAQIPAELSQILTAISGKLNDMSTRLDNFEAGNAKRAYADKLNRLATAGKINAAAVAKLEASGAKHGYDLSILDAFENIQMVDMGRRAGKLATNKPPAVSTGSGDLTADDIAEGAAFLSGKPKAKK